MTNKMILLHSDQLLVCISVCVCTLFMCNVVYVYDYMSMYYVCVYCTYVMCQ